MSWLRRALFGLLALLLFLFARLAVNQDPVALRFLNWQTPAFSVFWWLLIAFVLGLAVAFLGGVFFSTRLGLRNRRLAKRLSDVEQELDKARSLATSE